MASKDLSTEELAQGLIDACRTGDIPRLQELFQQRQAILPTINYATDLPTVGYLLQEAARAGRASGLRCVVETCPECHYRNRSEPWFPREDAEFWEIPERWDTGDMYNPIHATLEGVDPVACFCLFIDEYGMKPDQELDKAGNIFPCAVRYQTLDLVELLLQRGADPNGYVWDGTLLGDAAEQETGDTLELLVKYGAKVSGLRVLKSAVMYGRLGNAQRLLALGCDIDEEFLSHRVTDRGYALHFAVIGDPWRCKPLSGIASEAEIVRFLLEKGAKTDVLDGEGRTSFHRGHFTTAAPERPLRMDDILGRQKRAARTRPGYPEPYPLDNSAFFSSSPLLRLAEISRLATEQS